MRTTSDSVISSNTVFAWIALATCFVLLVPLLAMQFTTEVNWAALDFAVMAALLFATGSVFVLVARQVHRKYRLALAVVFATALFYAWAELSVGIFTSLGS